MNPFYSFLFFIAFILLFVVAGFFLGIYYSSQTNTSQLNSSQQVSIAPLVAELNSALFTPLMAHGKVTEIGIDSITLNNRGAEFAIKIKNGVSISKLVSVKNSLTYEAAQFSDIKVGATLDIETEVILDGSIIGNSIVIYPAS